MVVIFPFIQRLPKELHWSIIEHLSLQEAALFAKTCRVAREAFYSYFNLEIADTYSFDLWMNTYSPCVLKKLKGRLTIQEQDKTELSEMKCSTVKELIMHPEWIVKVCINLRLYRAHCFAKQCLKEKNHKVFYRLCDHQMFTPSHFIIFLDQMYKNYEDNDKEKIEEFVESSCFSIAEVMSGPLVHSLNSVGKFLIKIAFSPSEKTTFFFRTLLNYPSIGTLNDEYLSALCEKVVTSCNVSVLTLLIEKFPDFFTIDKWVYLCEYMRHSVEIDKMSRRELERVFFFITYKLDTDQKAHLYQRLSLDFRCFFWYGYNF